MNELERLGARVVTGRPSRESTGSDFDGNDGNASTRAEVVGARGALGSGELLNNSSTITTGSENDSNSPHHGPHTTSKYTCLPNTYIPNSSLIMSLGGSAASYEAARMNYYRNQAEKIKINKSRKILDMGESDRACLSGNSRRSCNSSNGEIEETFNNSNGYDNNAGHSIGCATNGLDAHLELLRTHIKILRDEMQQTAIMMKLYKQKRKQQKLQKEKLQQEKLLQEKAMLTQQHYHGQPISMGRKSLELDDYDDGQSTTSIPGKTPALIAAPSDAEDTSTTFAFQKTYKQTTLRTNHKDTSFTELNEHDKQLQIIKEEIEKKTRELAELEKLEGS